MKEIMAIALAASVFAAVKKEEPSGATIITVGAAGLLAPYGWVTPDGTLEGYDSVVIAAVDELPPQYTFKIEEVEFPQHLRGA
ncbi:MAG: hypothetical protein LBL45_12500 [Treponema sp.]|nr:hypothetical protein [Treponema sp.]